MKQFVAGLMTGLALAGATAAAQAPRTIDMGNWKVVRVENGTLTTVCTRNLILHPDDRQANCLR